MELTFEPIQQIGAGSNPLAVHTPENIVQIIFKGSNGRIFAKEASTPLGDWKNLSFSPEYMICEDLNPEYMKLKHVASSIFVVWKNAASSGEVVPYAAGVTHSDRHRLAVWETRQDLSKYLISGDIEFRLDDPVAKMNMNFENPGYIVSQEDDTILTPGAALLLLFRAGDSARYTMGRYYIDRNSMAVSAGNTNVSGRNAIGKLLKDQTFDDTNKFTVRNLKTLGENILDSFSVINYFVSDSTVNLGMEFPPDMSGLEGIQEILKTNMSWQLYEDLTGKIGFGEKTDSRFPQPTTYKFYRDKDIFSRQVERDDADAYSRVCVFNQDRTIQIYKDVNFRFVMGKRKTLHVPIAEGTTQADADKYALELTTLLSSVGTIETFTGPFKPHLLVGDNAEIITNGSKVLGIITSIRHSFGKDGFSTEFVVDSGSRANKTRVSDFINKIAGNQSNTQVKRLY